MTTRSTHSAVPVDPALKLADALRSGFAAQCAGHQRSRVPESQPVPR